MKNKGFSLVELIVVIAIMAILVGVAVPVYTSYIEKANAAKDEQLLGEINSAFAIVLASNAIDINTVTDATITVDEDGTVVLDGMTVEIGDTTRTDLDDAMIEILGTDLQFAVIEEIFYNKNVHRFVAVEDVVFNFNGKEITINSKDLAILSGDNAFSDRGAEALLGDVGTLESYLAGGYLDDGILAEIGLSSDFQDAYASYLGLNRSDFDTEQEYLQAYQTKLTELEATNPNAATNALIMYAASNAANASQDQIDDLFVAGRVTSNIEVKDATNTRDNAATMANAALAYGMYTSYLQRNPSIDANSNAGRFETVVNTTEFMNYYNSTQGQADLEAYKAAMSIISDNTDNPEVTSSILNNGITGNQGLEDLMKDIMGN